jgi:hypothetical protein
VIVKYRGTVMIARERMYGSMKDKREGSNILSRWIRVGTKWKLLYTPDPNIIL